MRHEKRLVVSLVASSTLFLYRDAVCILCGFPLAFAFLTGTRCRMALLLPPILQSISDFILTLFFAFGMAFEVPICYFLFWFGWGDDAGKTCRKRLYIIVGAFFIGMLLTPPDVISQTSLALPSGCCLRRV